MSNAGALMDSVYYGDAVGSAVKMTLVDHTGDIYIFRLVNPTSGSHKFYMYNASSVAVSLFAASFSGVNQAAPTGTVGTGSQGFGSTITATATLAANDYGLAIVRKWAAVTTTADAPTTKLSEINLIATGYRDDEGTNAFAFTFSGDNVATETVVPIKGN